MSIDWAHYETMLREATQRLPLEQVQIPLRERIWSLTLVRDQDALLSFANDLEHFPYGFLLWESALGLAKYLEAQPERIAGKKVLELGAGLGFAGMTAQALGAQVSQTDHQPGALAIARNNARQNGIEGIRYFVADWRSWDHEETYETLLGADILYESQARPFLAPIFEKQLAVGGEMILSDPLRPQAFEFMSFLETRGWLLNMETLDVPKESISTTETMPIAIYTARRRADPPSR